MGLLNKLKNVLFEEEEIEEVEEKVTPKVQVKSSTMELPKITKETRKEKQYDVEDETDRELFKAEKTFDFPAFDEDEFDDLVPKKKEEVKEVRSVREPERNDFTSRSRVTSAYSKPKREEYTSTRIVGKSEKSTFKKAFKPSPVISPVYGILDKNYKKEDVLTRDEVIEKKETRLDVDSVRKKAFGTLEDDLEKTLTESIETFYEEEKTKEVPVIEEEKIEIIPEEVKSLDEELDNLLDETSEIHLDNLLEDTVDDEIDVTMEMEIPSRIQKNNFEEEIEDSEEDIFNKDSDEIETEEVVEEKKEDVTDDTLENDLFDLIDSMYENREDE